MSLDTVSDGYLAQRAAQGQGAAFAELARRYGNVINGATHWPPAPYTREDLRQEALVGLLQACRAHERGRPFGPLAATCVRNRVRMARTHAARGKERVLTGAFGLHERGERDGLTLAERLPARDGIDPLRVVEAREQLQRISAALRALSPRYRAALASQGTATAGVRYHARRRLQQLLDRGVGTDSPARLEGGGYSREQVERALSLVRQGTPAGEAAAAIG